MENDNNKDDDELSTLSDREMVETATRELAELRELAKTSPSISPELIEKLEKQLEHFKAALAVSEQSDRDLAASAERLNAAAERLLTHHDLPDGKPIPIGVPKAKGN